MSAIQQLMGHYRAAAIALVTVLTLAIIGAVVLNTTPAGCGAANALKLKTARCPGGGNTAAVSYPTATSLAPAPTPTPTSGPVALPANPGSSANPPYNPNASAYPPYNPAASENPPYEGPLSIGGPPLPYPASGNGQPGVLLSCRLPVYAGGPGSGGFIVFPDQAFVADPRSAGTVPSPSPGGASPSPPPLYGPGYPTGWFGLTYDHRYGKWLPVPYRWISPDGVHYAYPLGGDIYVQNVSDGTELELGSGKGYGVMDVENDGVYAFTPNQPGLWFLPFSGSERELTATGFWQGEANGSAYGTPTSQVPQGATNTIERLDLKTGAVTAFFSQPGGQSGLLGFDLQGNPVIQVYYNNPPSNGNVIFIVYGPTSAAVIASIVYGGGYNPPYPQGSPIADAHGLWFSTGNGIVLYSGNAWYWMASIGGQLAGQCL